MSVTNDPVLVESLESLKLDKGAQLLLVRPYRITTHWLSKAQELSLTAVFHLTAQGATIRMLGFVTDAWLAEQIDASGTLDDFHSLADKHGAPIFDFARAIPLRTICIPKPWGQEIWYTGMEDRGVSSVASNYTEFEEQTATVPLPWLLSMAPEFIHRGSEISLLKILDPDPDSVKGDLYFELHRAKREVYVVTQIDEEAWPKGEAGIRLGMNQELRAQYSDDVEFRAAFLGAVQDYRSVREAIDSAPSLKVANEKREAELKLRTRMQSFTAIKTLHTGETVVVQPDTPHSLLHGVRVVEFQSPLYERYIISFGQQVLTQSSWDSEAAIKRMNLNAPEAPVFQSIEQNEIATVERIASFDEFSVWRVNLLPGGTSRLSADIPYAICIGLSGKTSIGGLTLQAEQACFLPHTACINAITNISNAASTCLIAAPGL